MSGKEKTLRIAVDVILIVLGIVFLIFGIKDAINKYRTSITPDNVLFARSYRNVSDDNIFKYVTSKEYERILESETGIIFIGNPNDAWSQVLVNPLSDIVREEADVIYYLESENDAVPQVIVVKDGDILVELHKSDIVDGDYEGIPIEYFDDERVDSLKESLRDISKLND